MSDMLNEAFGSPVVTVYDEMSETVGLLHSDLTPGNEDHISLSAKSPFLTHQNTKKTTYSALEYFEIRPWVPHVFFFKTSTIVSVKP